MRRSVLAVGAALFAALVYVGCGGGGGDSESSVGNLQGTWFGVVEDSSGTLEIFEMQVDVSGNILDVKVGGVSTGNTGFINEDWDENLFHVIYTTGTTLQGGIMIVDDQYMHAVYGDYGGSQSSYYCGGLEKGVVSPPAYASSDIVGTYAVGGAYAFTVDSSGSVPIFNWVGEAISMTVHPALTFSGSYSGGAFAGGFNSPAYIPSYGHYAGSMDVPSLGKMDITALVSPDKNFAAACARDIGTNPTSLYNFLLIGLVK